MELLAFYSEYIDLNKLIIGNKIKYNSTLIIF